MNIFEKYLKHKTKVEIEFYNQNNVKKTERTDFYNTDKYLLYRPQKEIVFKINQKINILIYTNLGIFVFETEILSLNSKLIGIKRPKNYKTVQRRELLRADLEIPFKLIDKNKEIQYKTKNISGSGFSFYCDEIYDEKTNFKVELDFKERKIFSRIKIIEIRKNLKKELPNYRYSIKFLSLNKADENYIIQMCMQENINSINI